MSVVNLTLRVLKVMLKLHGKKNITAKNHRISTAACREQLPELSVHFENRPLTFQSSFV